MIAIGRDGDHVLIIGDKARIRCTEDEARGALRQLTALLGAVPTLPGQPAPSRPPSRGSDVFTGDPVQEAMARDAASAPAPVLIRPPPMQVPEVVLASQEARRQRMLKLANEGGDE